IQSTEVPWVSLYQQGSQNIVCNHDEHTGEHDGRGGGETDGFSAMAICAHVREITLVTAYRGDDHRKNNGLDETFIDIFHLHADLNAMEIGAGIRTQEQYPGDVAADNAHEAKQSGEQGKAEDGSSDSGTDEVPERINAHGVKGVNLLGDTLDTDRSEEHTSELQSHLNLVCRLL